MDLFNSKNPVLNSVIIYMIIIICVAVIKPKFMYDYKKKEFKEFGTRNNQTYLTLSVTGVIVSIVVYNLFANSGISDVRYPHKYRFAY